ncbi:MAG: geranylgeranylglyceryl/heptaprenylglyceryl phosphate synthase, partial [Saprospiraceae bacterium]
MRELIYSQILQKRNKKQKSLAVLIDPDYLKLNNIEATINIAIKHNVDYFFIGGSLIIQDRLEECLKIIRERSNIPTILFPGNGFQLSHHADALMFLSLISGRNPEYLIGKHVEVAPKL